MMCRLLVLLTILTINFLPSAAQSMGIADVQIEWKVANRFPFFRNEADFRNYENAWRQYLLHVSGQTLGETEKAALAARSSIIGTEHVLNDRNIAFSQHPRENYDWRGWAAKLLDATCWNSKARDHSGCGSVERYLTPPSFAIDVSLRQLKSDPLFGEYNCDWQVNGGSAVQAPCTDPARLALPREGGSISVRIAGGPAISLDAHVKDLLVVGLGDSFASGEGNPDRPAALSDERRFRNSYPARASNDVTSNALWLDETCHRSLYSYQLRTALQMAAEDAHASVTYLGYSCSGAAVDDGILGPQSYVQYKSRNDGGNGDPAVNRLSGGKREAQMAMLLADLCQVKPERSNGLWTCPGNQFRRSIDYLLLSVGGNDIGFSNLIAWATLRDGASSILAKVFGATMPASTVRNNITDILPGAYARLARAFEQTLPLRSGDLAYDASRIILSAYPDILTDAQGGLCKAAVSNQSLDVQSSWLAFDDGRLVKAHAQLAALHTRMQQISGDLGWSFAARAYEDQPLREHGFCATEATHADSVTEKLSIPCWSPEPGCSINWSGNQGVWRPYNPQTESFPYALRQRWVRSFNDVFVIMNEKVPDQSGKIDDRASAIVFSETTGAMHPTAEGHAAMADAIMMDLRGKLREE
jgi:hypothetical protein